MIELSRHIESLMLKHDCVIVPGLGGFVTQYVPARRVDDEQLFLPPCRSVGFNPQLSLNDGLLVQSYMQAYDTNYPETVKLIDDAVKQLKDKLREEGEYELMGIGRLTLGIGGKYDFTPYEFGVLSPELYGLDTVSVSNFTQKQKEEQTETVVNNKGKKKKLHVKRTEKNYTISINRELVNYVAAAVVAIFFYCLWATPLNNTPQTNQQTASVVYEQLFNHATQHQEYANAVPVVPTQSATQPVTEVAKTTTETTSANTSTVTTAQPVAPVTTQTAETQTKAKDQPQQTESTLSKGKYTLVLASAISESNANEFSQKLKKDGYTEASPYRRGKMVRVVYGSYANEQAAQAALAKLRKHQAFADAWVMMRE